MCSVCNILPLTVTMNDEYIRATIRDTTDALKCVSALLYGMIKKMTQVLLNHSGWGIRPV